MESNNGEARSEYCRLLDLNTDLDFCRLLELNTVKKALFVVIKFLLAVVSQVETVFHAVRNKNKNNLNYCRLMCSSMST